ncbi:MAG: tRNA (guanine-N7)-methyltransferase [Deltaproteobacteria bacterium]|nr:tRNA (guanine-N7)-methyltransferase [Deltaproteobacteria bacterium]
METATGSDSTATDATGRPARYSEAPRFPDGPIDLRTVVPGDGPLELDVGFGRGRSLLERALLAPSSRLVGIEIKRKWAWIVEQRRLAAGLAGCRAFQADARDVLPRMVPGGVLARVFVHFPDPWWKKRHAKRALVNDAFLVELARLLAPEGELFVQTDVADRAEAICERVEALRIDGRNAFVNVAGPGARIADNPFGARSGREVRCEADGIPVHRFLFRRA